MKITVKASNNLFKELRSQPIDFKAAIFELIDNSIASMVDKEVNVLIELRGPWNKVNGSLDKEKATLQIMDDAAGIDISLMDKVLSPAALAGLSKNPMNRHGMGLKNALVNLGTTIKYNKNNEVEAIIGFDLSTKTKDSDKVYSVKELAYGEVNVEELDNVILFPKGHGTCIKIHNLNNVLTGRKDVQTFIWHLGYRYKNYLKAEHGRKLNLTVKFTDADNKILQINGQDASFNVQAVEPTYLLDKSEFSKTLPNGKGAKGKDWAANIRFGFAMTEDEIKSNTYPTDHLVRHQLSAQHPYHYRKPSINIIHNDIVLCQKDFSWLYKEEAVIRYWRNNAPRMEIHLTKGFDTTSIKNDIQYSSNVDELKEDIVELLKPYVDKNMKPVSYDNETVIKDKLEKILLDSFDNVKREVSNKYGGKMDFSLTRKGNDEIWEVKVVTAGYEEFMQLVSYLKIAEKKFGVLLAPDFNSNARSLAQDCQTLFGYNIELKELSVYNL